MKTKKFFMSVFYALVLFITLSFGSVVKAATVVTDISKAQFDEYISSSVASWSVVFRGGYDFGSKSEEIQVARNTAWPTEGGDSNTAIGDLHWSQPVTDVSVTLDAASNIWARAASTEVHPEFAVVRPTNQILILTADSQILGRSSTVSDIIINGVTIHNLFADGANANNIDYQAVSVTGFGDTVEFNANWAPSDAPAGYDQYVILVGLNNPLVTVPEPSSSLLFGVLTSLCVFKRRR